MVVQGWREGQGRFEIQRRQVHRAQSNANAPQDEPAEERKHKESAGLSAIVCAAELAANVRLAWRGRLYAVGCCLRAESLRPLCPPCP